MLSGHGTCGFRKRYTFRRSRRNSRASVRIISVPHGRSALVRALFSLLLGASGSCPARWRTTHAPAVDTRHSARARAFSSLNVNSLHWHLRPTAHLRTGPDRTTFHVKVVTFLLVLGRSNVCDLCTTTTTPPSRNDLRGRRYWCEISPR